MACFTESTGEVVGTEASDGSVNRERTGGRRHFRVFLSSPGDVSEERAMARSLFKEVLPYRALLRDRFSFEVLSWDDERAAIPLDAGVPPQHTVNSLLGRPRSCDLVIVILWSRLGTPVRAGVGGGKVECESGTVYEYQDALGGQRESGSPVLWVYRRTEQPRVALGDPDLEERHQQYRAVQAFCRRIIDDGGGVNEFATPEQFLALLDAHVEALLARLVAVPEGAKPSRSPGLALQTRVQSFIDEYLVSERCPVPFGGRAAELATLDEWLCDKGAPSRFLLTAPAGRGKSALVVRWWKRLSDAGARMVGWQVTPTEASGALAPWQVVFMPISIRFGTNLPEDYHKAIAQRLARVAGQDLAMPAGDPARFYADRTTELLLSLSQDGTRVLLILDGLDETLRGEFNADMLPRHLPASVRVLVSARQQLGEVEAQGWLSRLDWAHGVRARTLELGTLSESAVGDVLLAVGAPLSGLVENPGLVHRLAELTQGEPLLLRYYAEDLWSLGQQKGPGVTQEDLEGLCPGFGAYFDRWLDLQRRAWTREGRVVDQETVDTLLLLLAHAHGPMEAHDVSEVVAQLLRAPAALSVEFMLHPLQRFVLGNGRPGHGYVLAHPKIGDHLRLERFPSATPTVQQAFLNWGRGVVQAINSQHRGQYRASSYMLHHFRRHLEEADAPLADFMSLVADGWRRSWERKSASRQGFAADVAAAGRRARQGGLEHLPEQFRCLLVLSSLRTVGPNLSGEVVLAATQAGHLSLPQAADLARGIRARADRVRCWLGLADLSTDPVHRQSLMKEAWDTAKSDAGGNFGRVLALAALASALPARQRKPLVSEAVRLAVEIGSPGERVAALGAVLPCAEPNRLPGLRAAALAALESIQSPADRALVSSQWLAALVEAGVSAEDDKKLFATEIEAIFLVDAPRVQLQALAHVGSILSDDDVERALNILLDNIEDCPIDGAALLDGLVGRLSAAKESRLLEAARAIRYPGGRGEVLSGIIAATMHENGLSLVNEALAEAQACSVVRARGRVFRRLAKLKPELLSEALHETARIHDLSRALSFVGAIASCEVIPQRRKELLARALELAQTIGESHARASALAALVPHLADEEKRQIAREALAQVRRVADADFRAHIAFQVVNYLEDAGRSREVIAKAVQETTSVLRESPVINSSRLDLLKRSAEVLSENLHSLHRTECDEHIRQLVETISELKLERDRAFALFAIGPYLRANLLEAAVEFGAAISEPWLRTLAMSGLARDGKEGEAAAPFPQDLLLELEGIDDHGIASHVLAAIAAQLDRESRAPVIQRLLRISSIDHRARAWRDLGPVLSAEEQMVALDDLMRFGDVVPRPKLLEALTPYVPLIVKEGGEGAVDAMVHTVFDCQEWYP